MSSQTYVEPWRQRLRKLVTKGGRRQCAVAARAGVSEEGLSRILTGETREPRLATIQAIVQACGETMGWLLEEPGYCLSAAQRDRLREAAAIIETFTAEK